MAGLEPAGGVQVEALDEARRARAQFGRQGGHHLELGRRHDRAQPELRGRTREPGQEQGFGLVGGQPGQTRPVAVHEADPAVRATVRIDRDTGGRQRLHVAMDRPDRHLQLGRQLAGGQATARLEEEQQVDEAAGTHPGRIARYRTEPVR